jgi:branched-chain amino acid aminotransferase group I
MIEKVYINGALVPSSEARISVSDHGFLYGYGLFETMRAYNGRLFLPDRHIRRLKEAAEVIGMGEKVRGIDFEKACKETLAANGLKEARVRLTVTNGDGATLPWVDAGGLPTVVVTARPYTPISPGKYEQGYRVGMASARRMKQSTFSAMKSINHLMNVAARMEAAAKGYDEAILLNDEGYIAEGGSSNIFFVRESRLVTPSLSSGIIPGVTRGAVIELAHGLGIGVSEGPVGIGAIRNCEEAFMTNAMIEVMPVTEVRDDKGKGKVIGDGKPGEITRKLMQAYREMVETATSG